MAKQQKETITIPKGYRPSVREAIAIDILERIRERTTKEFKDKDNKPFKGYSKAYVKSLAFNVAGKKESQVNLTLTGDMLDLLEVLDTKKAGKIVIGYDKSDDATNGKVEGNRLGTYGKSKQVGPKRDFLGIHHKDLKKILSKYPLDDEIKLAKRVEKVLEVSKEAEKYDAESESEDI